MENNKQVIFVYGTLMRGERAAHMLNQYEYLGDFTLKDYGIYQVSYYPGIKEVPGACVLGEAYLVDDACIKAMDAYEDEGALYLRKMVQIVNEKETRDAFVYVYNKEVTGPMLTGKWSFRESER